MADTKNIDDGFKNADNVEQEFDDEAAEEALQERIDAELERVNGPKNDAGIRENAKLPDKYVGFTIRYRCFWIWINLFNIATSVAMSTGAVMILGLESDQSTMSYQQCQSMEVVCWMLFILHIMNFIFSALALCGLEKKWCISYVLLALIIFDIVILCWSQATYFSAQSYNCNLEMPEVYFWLMGEILFFYCLTAFVVCYFFRRFCQDPALRAEIEAMDAEEAAAEEAVTDDEATPTPAGTDNKTNLDFEAIDEAPAKPNKTKKADVPKK